MGLVHAADNEAAAVIGRQAVALSIGRHNGEKARQGQMAMILCLEPPDLLLLRLPVL